MKYIGAHVSTEGGVFNAPLNATKIGANAFALFLKNQRRWESAPYKPEEIEKFKKNLEASGIPLSKVLPHDSYLINIGNPEDTARDKSLAALKDELERADALGLKLLNIHPGSHLKAISEEECMDRIAAGINTLFTQTSNVTILIENTAGQGSNIGYKFEHLAYLIHKIDNKERIGVCIDTCHTFAGGYELRTKEGYEATMADFEKIVGLHYLKGMHLNDSMSDFASKKDRHHSIGQGKLGVDLFKFLMEDKRTDDIPLILETINPELWQEEISLLRSMAGE